MNKFLVIHMYRKLDADLSPIDWSKSTCSATWLDEYKNMLIRVRWRTTRDCKKAWPPPSEYTWALAHHAWPYIKYVKPLFHPLLLFGWKNGLWGPTVKNHIRNHFKANLSCCLFLGPAVRTWELRIRMRWRLWPIVTGLGLWITESFSDSQVTNDYHYE